MGDWNTLVAKVGTYSKGTAAGAIMLDLTTSSITQSVPVGRDSMMATIMTMTTPYVIGTNTATVPMWDALQQDAAQTFPQGTVARQAILIRDYPNYPDINVLNPAFQSYLTAIGRFSADQIKALTAMGTEQVSWADANGWSAITMGDVVNAMNAAGI